MSAETASSLVVEPEPSDPLDGYEGSLAQAGINTDMDWGPKQSLLLDKYKTLLETHSQLKKDHEESLRINQNLQSQLHSEQAALTQEKSSRAQSEAETERLRQRNRDHEAKILSLSFVRHACIARETCERASAGSARKATASRLFSERYLRVAGRERCALWRWGSPWSCLAAERSCSSLA